MPLLNRSRPVLAMAGLVALLAGCAGVQQPRQPVEPAGTQCKAATPGDALVGNWLGVRKQPGVAGELHNYFALKADGTMNYAEQLRRPGKAPQGLAETGCWHRDGKTMVLRTVESNGSPVDLGDPIYINRYELTRESGDRMSMTTPDGAKLDVRRMPPDYRVTW